MKNIGDKILSKHTDFSIHLTGWEEPNNGRMLWTFNLLNNDKIVDDNYSENWAFLNFNLENFELESKDGSYLYIPLEGNGIVLNTKTMKVAKTPYKGLSTHYFIGNYFTENKLIVNYRNEIVLIDLDNENSLSIIFPEDKMTIKNSSFDDGILTVEMFDKEKKEILKKRYTTIFDEIK